MTPTNMILELSIATVDFQNQTISWKFQGYSPKAEREIRYALQVAPTTGVPVESIARIFNLYAL